MKILDKLKAIGIHFPKLEKISLIKLSIRIDNSIRVEGGSTLVINPDKLNGKQKRALKTIITTDGLEEAGAIVEESNSATVNEALEALPEIRLLANKFLPIIPPADIPLLHACLFLRKRFQSGESVDPLKGQIMRVYGTRGGNFANLCSAGYLEEWFGPLYDELSKTYPSDPATAKLKFQALYNLIVSELPWTEFVSGRVSAEKVTEHVVQKIKRNIQNGVRYLNIHGLGPKNVAKTMKILPDIQAQTGAVSVRIDKDQNRIFIRLEIPTKP
jgi:hypothetical protein